MDSPSRSGSLAAGLEPSSDSPARRVLQRGETLDGIRLERLRAVHIPVPRPAGTDVALAWGPAGATFRPRIPQSVRSPPAPESLVLRTEREDGEAS